MAKSSSPKPQAAVGASTFTRFASNCFMKCTTRDATSPRMWVLDMDELTLHDLGDARVQVRGAIGHPAPAQLKLVAGFRNGWLGHMVTGFCWPDALAKAQAVADTVQLQMQEKNIHPQEVCIEYLGHNSFLGPHAHQPDEDDVNEIWLRMAIRTSDKKHADAFPRLFPWLALSRPPFMGGFHGMHAASTLLALSSFLVSRQHI